MALQLQCKAPRGSKPTAVETSSLEKLNRAFLSGNLKDHSGIGSS